MAIKIIGIMVTKQKSKTSFNIKNTDVFFPLKLGMKLDMTTYILTKIEIVFLLFCIKRLALLNIFIAVCLLDFEVVEGKVVVDQSGKGNNAYLDKSAVVRPHDQMCGHYADLTGEGDIILVDKTFRGKPQTGITIACWVNLQGSLTAKHSLFSTVRMVSPVNFIGMLLDGFLCSSFYC